MSKYVISAYFRNNKFVSWQTDELSDVTKFTEYFLGGDYKSNLDEVKGKGPSFLIIRPYEKVENGFLVFDEDDQKAFMHFVNLCMEEPELP